jgi:hypothetical protein
MLVIEGLGEVHYLLAVELGKVWVQSRHGRGRGFQPSDEVHSPGLQDCHLVPYSGARHTRLDGFN